MEGRVRCEKVLALHCMMTFSKHSRASRDFWFFAEEPQFFCQQCKSAHLFLKEESLSLDHCYSMLQISQKWHLKMKTNIHEHSCFKQTVQKHCSVTFYNTVPYRCLRPLRTSQCNLSYSKTQVSGAWASVVEVWIWFLLLIDNHSAMVWWPQRLRKFLKSTVHYLR